MVRKAEPTGLRQGGGRGRKASSPVSVSTGSSGDLAAPSSTSTRNETCLDNGIRVRTERVPTVRSAAVGIWVRQGAAHEHANVMGVSHLLEHMVFKGTRTRSAAEIALSLEARGGTLDAYTSREHTSVQARVLDRDLPLAVDVISDLVRNPLLRERDLDLEREVVLEEIAEVDDTPDDLVHELFGLELWGTHPYGHHILGTRETVGSMQADDLRRMHGERYVGANLVVAAAGHVDHDELVAQVERCLGDLEPGTPTPVVAPPPATDRFDRQVERAAAQTHLVMGSRSVAHSDRLRLAVVLVSQAFGGGMSSRLFQRIREEMGLVYSVYSFHSFYDAGGLTGVYLGTRPEWRERAREAVLEEYERLASHSLGHDELEQARQQLKGQIMLALESTVSRMYHTAGSALHDEPWLDLDGLLAQVDAVSADDVAEACELGFGPQAQCALMLGPAGPDGAAATD